MSNYSHFWSLYNKLPGRHGGLKEELVSQFTNSRTTSLREMHPPEYANLLEHMSSILNPPSDARKQTWSNLNIDSCRKRVIASICGYFTLTGKPYTMRLVLSTAARAAKINDFNLIPADELRRIYNTFRAKQIDCEKAATKERVKMNRLSMN